MGLRMQAHCPMPSFRSNSFCDDDGDESLSVAEIGHGFRQ